MLNYSQELHIYRNIQNKSKCYGISIFDKALHDKSTTGVESRPLPIIDNQIHLDHVGNHGYQNRKHKDRKKCIKQIYRHN